jgi:adenine-specific DNA-methyltransferase
MFDSREIADKFSLSRDIVLFPGDCLDLLRTIPDESLTLVITSPPYNIGKQYEKRLKLQSYVEQQAYAGQNVSPLGSCCMS